MENTLIGKSESLERYRQREELRRRARGGVTRAEYLANFITMQKPWEKLGVSRSHTHLVQIGTILIHTLKIRETER
jgi:hypothetical protein